MFIIINIDIVIVTTLLRVHFKNIMLYSYTECPQKSIHSATWLFALLSTIHIFLNSACKTRD